MIGFVERCGCLDVQQHVTGLQNNTLSLERLLGRSQHKRFEFPGYELAELSLDLPVDVGPGRGIPLVDVEVGHARRGATFGQHAAQEVTHTPANHGRTGNNRPARDIPDSTRSTPGGCQSFLVGRRHGRFVQHRRRLLVVRVSDHQPHAIPVGVAGDHIKVEVAEQQHLPGQAGLQLVGTPLGTSTNPGKLTGEPLESLLAHLLHRVLADLVARRTLHRRATSSTDVVLEGRKAPLFASLLGRRLLVLSLLQRMLVLEHLPLTSLGRQYTQPRMRPEPVPLAGFPARQRHADHLVGQIRRHHVRFPLDRQHNIASSHQVDLLPISTPRIRPRYGRLTLQFEIEDFQPIECFGERVEIQGALELLSLVLEHHEATDRDEIVPLSRPDSLAGVIDRTTISLETFSTSQPIQPIQPTNLSPRRIHRQPGSTVSELSRTGVDSGTATHRTAGSNTTSIRAEIASARLTVLPRRHGTATRSDSRSTGLAHDTTRDLPVTIILTGQLLVVLVVRRNRPHDRLARIGQDFHHRQQDRHPIPVLLLVWRKMERSHVLESRHVDLVLPSPHRRANVRQTIESRLLSSVRPASTRMCQLGGFDLGLELVRVCLEDRPLAHIAHQRVVNQHVDNKQADPRKDHLLDVSQTDLEHLVGFELSSHVPVSLYSNSQFPAPTVSSTVSTQGLHMSRF